MRISVTWVLALALAAAPALAQDKPGKDEKPAKVETVVPQVHTSKHSGVFGGQKVGYGATIAETIIAAEDGTQKAAIVTTSYVKEPRDPSRPVTFLFNGGPGSGSVWLQMGAFGPKRVAIPSDARDDGAPPYPLVDNPDSLLDVTDLVFIDPPGTGFSHLIGKTEP
jgi:carboxypeptidase C (cathepsin A)